MRARIILTEPLTDHFKLRHPGLKEVAVLEKDPVPFTSTFIDHFSGDLLLPLSQTLVDKPLVELHFVGKLNHLLCRICALTQDEYYGSLTI